MKEQQARKRERERERERERQRDRETEMEGSTHGAYEFWYQINGHQVTQLVKLKKTKKE